MSFKLPIGVATTKSRAIALSFSVAIVLFLNACQSSTPTGTDRRQDLQTSTGDAATAHSPREPEPLNIQAQLHTLRVLIETRRVSEAAQLLQRLRQRDVLSSLSKERQFELAALELQLAMSVDPAGSIRQIDLLKPTTINQRLAALKLQSTALALNGDNLSAVERLLGSPYHDEPTINDLVWSIVRMTPHEQQLVNRNATTLVAARLWWELGVIDSTSLSLNTLNTRFGSWRRSVAHNDIDLVPASEFVPRTSQPTEIALLLPQSGELLTAAKAIRDGFIHAQLQDVATNNDLRLRIFDTSVKPVADVVAEAVNAGADAIVGPLDKDRVRELALQSDLSVPIVAFNRVDDRRNSSNLYQLGLLVEDDAVLLADLLRTRGINRVVLIQSASPWATRAAITLLDHLGPETEVVTERVLNDLSEITDVVGEALHVSRSQARFDAIQQVARNDFEFVARRRQDIDGIVAFLGTAEFELLTAALDFHFAADVPIFVAEPSIRDLTLSLTQYNGIYFTICPVQVHEAPRYQRIRASTGMSPDGASLHGLGFDAYQIVNQLELLQRGVDIWGTTGRISLGPNGMLERSPALKTVRNGKIVPVHLSVPTVSPSAPPA